MAAAGQAQLTENGCNTEKNTKYPGLRPPWKPGQSGNPNGRPKKPLTEAYKAILAKPIPDEIAAKLKVKQGTTYAEVIALALAREAVKGKVAAAAELADRVEGRVPQPQEFSGPGGAPMQFESLGSRAEVEAKIAVLLFQADERRSEALPQQDTEPPLTIEAQTSPAPDTNRAPTGHQPVGKKKPTLDLCW